ncbi:PAS domain-containing sensor histidine kinase [filamentous cyanobacterium CCP1]|nr:PAS domain-containing sensor histidine kinase [filamentous cyanobacterium CCP2]PSB67238.1 PAS domain-containing sensor histidine kinase [filamentous cyanobacterium CCP1]
MAILEFILGLSTGLTVLWWRHSRSEARLRGVLQNLQSDVLGSSFSPSSQLTLAIAQQQKVHQQLRQTIHTYDEVLHNAPIGYLQVDDESRLIWCNAQAKQILGICQDTCPKKPRLLLELVRSYELDDLIEKTRDAGKSCQVDWTFYPANSDPSHLAEQQAYALRGYGLPLPDHQVGIFLENRQEAVALMQRYDRWASDIAHELKTPLTSIRLVAETLQYRLDPSLKAWVDRLINETIRLSTLVQDLLDLSRLQRDSLHSLRLKRTDLVELIYAVWDSLEPLAQKNQVQFDYEGPEHLVVKVDEARIHRLLINLIENSIKYSPSQQVIQVQLRVETVTNPEDYTKEEQVCLDVIDCGAGFAEKDLPYVFDRFYRADPSRARKALHTDPSSASPSGSSTAQLVQPSNDGSPSVFLQGGSGLGLAIVRQIVEAHQGSVNASNHPETGGAWLQVRLPFQS